MYSKNSVLYLFDYSSSTLYYALKLKQNLVHLGTPSLRAFLQPLLKKDASMPTSPPPLVQIRSTGPDGPATPSSSSTSAQRQLAKPSTTHLQSTIESAEVKCSCNIEQHLAKFKTGLIAEIKQIFRKETSNLIRTIPMQSYNDTEGLDEFEGYGMFPIKTNEQLTLFESKLNDDSQFRVMVVIKKSINSTYSILY